MGWSSPGDAVAALNAQAIAMGWSLRCYEDLDFVQPELNALRDVWRDKARETGRPSRADFDARSLKRFLPHVWFAQRVAAPSGATRYRNRLFGSELVRAFGEQTGRHLDELLPEPQLECWTAIYETLLACSQPLRIISRFDRQQVNWFDSESFLAPLASGGARSEMILGAMYVTARKKLRAAV